MTSASFIFSSHLFKSIHNVHLQQSICMKTSQTCISPILVTGASGFIGNHVIQTLLQNDYHVHAVSRTKSPDWPTTNPNFHFYNVDLTDIEFISSIVEKQKWHSILHLAGLISYTSRDYPAMHLINSKVTQTLVNTLSLNTRLIFISTVAAVGSNSISTQLPLIETTQWDSTLRHSQVAYAKTKREAEEYVIKAAKHAQINATILCPSNVYGPGDARKSSRKTQIKAANGQWPIYTDGGVNIVHIDVIVQALLALIETPLDDPLWRGERWLLVGENITIKKMLSLCAEQGGNQNRKPWLKLPYILLWLICFIGEKLGSNSFTTDRLAMATRYHWYDGRKARDRFQLKQVSARECIADSVQWMKENGLIQKSTPNN